MKIRTRHWLISTGDKSLPIWLQKYAGATCLVPTNNLGEYQLFITGRDDKNRSVIGYAYWCFNNPSELYGFSDEPVLALGGIGAFYEAGTSYPSIFGYQNNRYMLFTGWMKGVDVPFYNTIGIAKFDHTRGKFICEPAMPIIPNSGSHYLGTGSSLVLQQKDTYQLFYTNFDNWRIENGKQYHSYSLRVAKSSNPLVWNRKSQKIAISLSRKLTNICKPSFLGDKLVMSAREDKSDYGLYISRSAVEEFDTPIEFTKIQFDEHFEYNRDELGQAYPTGLIHGDKKFIFYSGNSYGATGLGLIEV